jgi:endo-1,4-beta-xylanase
MPSMTRRRLLRTGVAAAVGSVWPHATVAESTAGLRTLVPSAKVRLGAQATYTDLQNAAYASFIASNFNTLTAGLEMKWSALRPSPTTFDFKRADWMVAFAERHNMSFRGHNLCWNHWLPAWVARTVNAANVERVLTDHITTVAGRYRGRIDSWDVVNEPLGTWNSPVTGQPPRPWLDLLGSRYLDIAFHATAAADPAALRVLNFDRLEQTITANQDDRRNALSLIQGLVQRKVPIQAVGFESHLLAWDNIENPSQDRLIQSIRDLGLKILITELDVNDTRIAGPIATRDQTVASIYFDYITRMVPRMGCDQIVFWTPWDGSDWLDDCHGRDYDRLDGAPHRPGLIDTALRTKPAYESVAQALRQLYPDRAGR